MKWLLTGGSQLQEGRALRAKARVAQRRTSRSELSSFWWWAAYRHSPATAHPIFKSYFSCFLWINTNLTNCDNGQMQSLHGNLRPLNRIQSKLYYIIVFIDYYVYIINLWFLPLVLPSGCEAGRAPGLAESSWAPASGTPAGWTGTLRRKRQGDALITSNNKESLGPHTRDNMMNCSESFMRKGLAQHQSCNYLRPFTKCGIPLCNAGKLQ